MIAIIPTADREKGTVKVRIGFDKLDPKILPDMGVKVAFEGQTEESADHGGVAGGDRAVARCASGQFGIGCLGGAGRQARAARGQNRPAAG